MDLLHTLKQEYLIARQEKIQVETSLLMTLISEIERIGKDQKKVIEDKDVVEILQKFRKNILFNLENLPKIEDTEKRLELNNELQIIEKFLPKKLSEEELTTIIKDMIDHDSSINIGKIMAFLKSQYSGRYDGKLASSIAKSIIPN